MIRFAESRDASWLLAHDRHVSPDELEALIARQRILLICEDDTPIGWLRWNLFWDNTPFMNLLYVLEPWQRMGIGRKLTAHWEELMRAQGFDRLLTSTQADEEAQHFYRRLGYREAGVLLLPGETAELLFCKELKA